MMEILTRDQAIRKARNRVVGDYGDERRKWLISPELLCYGNPKYPTEIHVLEGSPARGYVLVADDFAIAITMTGECLRKYEFFLH